MARALHLLLSTAVAAAGSTGCSKAGAPRGDAPAAEPDPASAAAFAPGSSVASFSGSFGLPGERAHAPGPSGSSLAAPSAAPPDASRRGSAARTSDDAGLGAPCSGTPRRPCILHDWMEANTAPAIVSGDFDALETALDRVAAFAPPGYPNWASIARDGADAARVEDLEAVKAACRSCHAQYKERYRRELHDRVL